MASTFLTLLPSTRSGRTFFVALSLLGVLGLGQLLVLGGYLLRGGIAARQVAEIHFAESPLLAPATTPIASIPLLPMVPTPAPAAAIDPSLATNAVVAQPTPNTARYQTGSGDLLEQARQLRVRGDTNSALARLREAQVAEPDNPQIIAEMALTYEAMQIPDRAFEQWQRLYAMGEGVGALYYLADSRLHAAPASALAAESRTAANVGTTSSDQPAGALLKLADIHKEEVADPSAEQKVVLNIVVKNKPGTVIDPNKVRILTFFYDLVDGKSAVLTDAQTGFAWLTPAPVNWANDKSEVLETTYYRPKVAVTPAATPEAATRNGKPRSHRKGEAAEVSTSTPEPTQAPVRVYLGYTVRLYYDGQLQDAQADPVRLLQQFPPPATLANE